MSKSISSIFAQLLAEHQQKLDTAMQLLNKLEGISSSSFLKDTQTNHSFEFFRDDKSFSVIAHANGAKLKITVSLPVSAETAVNIETTDLTGNTTSHVVKFSDYLKGFEVPSELKDVFSKVSKYLNAMIVKPTSNSSQEQSPNGSASATPSTATASGESAVKGSEKEKLAESPQQLVEYTLARDNDRSLRFAGTLLASLRTPLIQGRHKEVNVFKTRSGKYVAQIAGHSMWPTESMRSSVKVCETPQEVLDFFGPGPVTAKLIAILEWQDNYTEYLD